MNIGKKYFLQQAKNHVLFGFFIKNVKKSTLKPKLKKIK